MAKIEVTASVPDTNFIAIASGATFAEARDSALEKLDKKIDVTHNIGKGTTTTYEVGRKLKESVVFNTTQE